MSISSESVHIPKGIQSIEGGAHRPKSSEKRVINGTCDVNQLEPFGHLWAWDKYIKSLGNHWTPNEISMLADIDQWRNPDLQQKLSDVLLCVILGFSQQQIL